MINDPLFQVIYATEPEYEEVAKLLDTFVRYLIVMEPEEWDKLVKEIKGAEAKR